MPMTRRPGWLGPAAGVGLAYVAGRALHRVQAAQGAQELFGQVVLITGSSRGLGLALARELAGHGCKIVLSARDADELARAEADIAAYGVDAFSQVCDVTDRAAVERLIAAAIEHFGRIDVLINNAGLISVGPFESQRLEDFERAMNVMFWGTVYASLAVLPAMRARRAGHIVNITSIGGKVAIPHLASYSAAKFAAVGFSESLHVELASTGVHVLTVVPGLMRTGSHKNALFKGDTRQEFGWFSLAASLPLTSTSAEVAAHQIVEALRAREAEVILTWQAGVLARVHGLAPGLTGRVLALVDRLLPSDATPRTVRGADSRGSVSESFLTSLGRRAARNLNQRRPG